MHDIKSITIIFQGIKFRRYPESKNRSDRVYYKPSSNYIKKGIQYLHCEIWKSYHGKIPKGYQIHHKDNNPDNNDISNLEIKEKKEHRSYHSKKWAKENREYLIKHLKKIRCKANKWHKSKEGRVWHKEHAKKQEFGKIRIDKICIECGKKFKGSYTSKFCCINCKSKHRRKSGVDNIQKECMYCKKIFITNKYDQKKYCSKSCSAKDQWKILREKKSI